MGSDLDAGGGGPTGDRHSKPGALPWFPDSYGCDRGGSAGGRYKDGSDHHQAFAISKVNGVWDQVREVPGTAALNTGAFASVFSVSCASAGNCGAGGEYQNASGVYQAFVVGETG